MPLWADTFIIVILLQSTPHTLLPRILTPTTTEVVVGDQEEVAVVVVGDPEEVVAVVVPEEVAVVPEEVAAVVPEEVAAVAPEVVEADQEEVVVATLEVEAEDQAMPQAVHTSITAQFQQLQQRQ